MRSNYLMGYLLLAGRRRITKSKDKDDGGGDLPVFPDDGNIIIGGARLDENGDISGGQPGDQTGAEVATGPFYLHNSGWYCLRISNPEYAQPIANAMIEACNNDNIGYSQSARWTVWTQMLNYGSLGAIATPCDADCSSLVRCCIYQGTNGLVDIGQVWTGSLASACESSGYFDSRFAVTSSEQLYNGDVLVTQSPGHAEIVVGGRNRPLN